MLILQQLEVVLQSALGVLELEWAQQKQKGFNNPHCLALQHLLKIPQKALPRCSALAVPFWDFYLAG